MIQLQLSFQYYQAFIAFRLFKKKSTTGTPAAANLASHLDRKQYICGLDYVLIAQMLRGLHIALCYHVLAK